MNFNEQNRQYESMLERRESRRIEKAEDQTEHCESTAGKDPDAWSHKATDELILRHNINAVRMVEKAMGINRGENE